jgi:hypothetical protein
LARRIANGIEQHKEPQEETGPNGKRKDKDHVIEYEMDIDDHKAAVRAAREQYEETLFLVNGEPLSVLEEMRKDHDILSDGCVELTGHVADLKKIWRPG